MKKLYVVGIATYFLIGGFLFSQTAFFWLSDAGDPRAMALANSLVAEEVGIDGISHNPAGMSLPEDNDQKRNIAIGLRLYAVGITQQGSRLVLPTTDGSVGFELQKMDYGTFDGYDRAGNSTPNYSSQDFLIRSAGQYNIGKYLSIGASFGAAFSQLEESESIILLWTTGAQFSIPAIGTRIGVVSQNNGKYVDQYEKGSADRLPSSLLVGISKDLTYLPLTLYLSCGETDQVEDFMWRLGGEFRLASGLALRIGVDQGKTYYSRGNTYEDLFSGLSLGVGIKPTEKKTIASWRRSLSSDWAIKLMGPLGLSSSMAIGWRF